LYRSYAWLVFQVAASARRLAPILNVSRRTLEEVRVFINVIVCY